tara:strand:+ start:544 stop:3720 length:3177 start_codon:yes stop_codon:yes gene_type:complete
MANTPTVKVQKAKLYKMISYKGTVGGKKFSALTAADELSKIAQDQDKAFKSITSGMNSLGASLNGIALQMEAMTQAMKDRVASKIRGDKIIKKQEDAADKAEADREKKKTAEEKRRELKKKRDEAEDQSEKKKKKKGSEVVQNFKEAAKSAFGGFLGAIARFLGGIFKIFLVFGALDWISKNPDKVQKLAQGLAAIGKFVWNITSFLVGSAFDGLVKFLENPISLKGIIGLGQFLLSAAPIFLGIAFLKNPLATAKTVGWVVTSLIKGILNIGKAARAGAKVRKFMGTKLGKGLIAGGLGVSAFLGEKGAGASNAEAVGAGVGTAGGALVGEAIGSKLGGPLGGMIGGAAGAFVGGKAGKAIGGFMEPIFKPIGRFFSMIGDVFKQVMAPIKDSLSGFFEILGKVMTQVLDFIEPHLPMISKLVGIGIEVAFAPLFMGIKALTAVLKFFAPKTDEVDKEKSKSGKAAGGRFQTAKMVKPQMASGGTFNLQDEMAKQLRKTAKLAKAFGQLMLLPFKALGVGIMTAIGGIGKVFGAFLPAPIRNMLGAMIAPLAKIFGVSTSVIGGSAANKEDMKGGDKGKTDKDPAITWEEKLLEAIAGDHGTISLIGKLFSAILDHPIMKGVKAVAGGIFSGVGRLFGFAAGGQVPQASMGGWISGPMSGYPVSLDGGATTAFIGHGTEWVGMKGFAGGGAFVVPFDTPATRGNPGLTSQRMGEAMRGGYTMPFSRGGNLPKFAAGGKFDPKAYAKDSFQASRVVLNDKSYYVTYDIAGEGADPRTVTIKSMSKRTKAANLIGQGEERVGVKPDSPEFKAVMSSGGLKQDIASRHKYGGGPRNRNAKAANIGEIKIHPQAMLAYRYNKSYQDNYASWKSQPGISDEQARHYASHAALNLAEVSADGKSTTTATTRGEENLIVNEEGQTADELTPPPASSDDSKEKKKKETVDEKIKRLFGKDGALRTGLKEMGKALSTSETTNQNGTKVDDAAQAKTESKLDNLKALTAQRAAAMQPIVMEKEAAPIMGGGESEIIIPGSDKNDADDFLMPKFGVLTEFNSTLSNLM